MQAKWLAMLFFYKNVFSFNFQSDSWDGISPTVNTANTRTMKQKSGTTYNSNPLMPTKEISASVFPDVIYPISNLDVREPFYFTSSGFDDLLRPFSDDVKMSYTALKSEKEINNNVGGRLPKRKKHKITNNVNLNAPTINNNIQKNIKKYDTYHENTTRYDCNCDDEGTLNDVNFFKVEVDPENGDIIQDFINNIDSKLCSNTSIENILLPISTEIDILNVPENITSEEYITTIVSSNEVHDCITTKLLNKTEVQDDFETENISEDLISNLNDLLISVPLVMKPDTCEIEDVEGIRYLPDWYISNGTKTELIEKLFNTKGIFSSIMNILQNVQDEEIYFPYNTIDNTNLKPQDFQLTCDDILCNFSQIIINTANNSDDSVKVENELDVPQIEQLVSYNNFSLTKNLTEEIFNNRLGNLRETFTNFIENIKEISRVKEENNRGILRSKEIVPSKKLSVSFCDEDNEVNETTSNNSYDLEFVDLNGDEPDESNIKSSASSLSILEGLGSSKTPLFVLFNYFPSSSMP